MKTLDGRKVANKILDDLKREIAQKKLRLKLAIIQVGKNEASEVFIQQKQKACRDIGIQVAVHSFPRTIQPKTLQQQVAKIGDDPHHHGVIIQLPLPERLASMSQRVLNEIPAEKDVDVLSERAIGKLCTSTLPLTPPVVCAIRHLADAYHLSLKNKHIVLVGMGRLVGFPLALQLFHDKANVTVVDAETKNMAALTKTADVIISGVGTPNLIKDDMVQKGVVVFDAGASFVNGKMQGDVAADVAKKAAAITPVPGGIGPVTVACVLQNLVKLTTG